MIFGDDEMSRQEALREAIAQRDQFLEAYPHLKEEQAELDRLLASAGGVHNRLAVLGFALQERLMKLSEGLTMLHEVTRSAQKATVH